MYKKAVGSMLMILGTSFGAGMLALPVVTTHEHYAMSLMLLLASWVVMTFGALSILEVNLWLKPGANLISMARATLGKSGEIFTWVVYLLLLYSLICAYLSGTSDIMRSLLANIGIHLPVWLTTLLSLGLISTIVGRGMASVDIVNRSLISVKLIAYIIIVSLAFPHLKIGTVLQGDYQWHNSATMVMLTSFGYAIIIPSLRSYLDSNTKMLRTVMLVGSILPLLIYALWIFVIQGLIPRAGTNGLLSIASSGQINSMLMQTISQLLQTSWIGNVSKLFISICAITSFLGVSLCLTDFADDGLNTIVKNKSKWLTYAISYFPPLLIVLISPGIFIRALDYAGLLCLLLLIILPLTMLYVGRYRKNVQGHRIIPGGKVFIASLLALGMALVAVNI